MRQAKSSGLHRLRVLHVIPKLTGGGAENFLCALATNMNPSLVRTGIMAVYPTQIPFDEHLRNIEIINIDRTGRYDPGFLPRMIRAMRRFQPDIVHAHLHNGKYWGRLAALVARVPIVLFTEHSPHGEKRGIAEILFDRLVNCLTDGIITFTPLQRDLLAGSEHLSVDKITVIENGISLPPPANPQLRAHARLRLGAREDETAILFLGRLVPIKNPKLAILAMHRVSAAARERVRMYIIGSGDAEYQLHGLANDLGISDRVVFLGHRDDAVQLLYGGDALYVPSFVEGMPLAALEAMAVGLPVISSPWPGSEDLLDHSRFGIILADWRPETAATAFEELSNRRGEFQEIGERAARFARPRYDITRVARLHEQVYLRLAQSKGLR